MLKHYVTFYSPGTLFPETTTRPIERWDPKLAVQLSKDITERHGAKPFGFKFKTLDEAENIIDDQGRERKVESIKMAESGFYFLNGRVFTLDEAIREHGGGSTVVSNMYGQRFWIGVVTTNVYRHSTEFGEGDFAVNADGDITERGDSVKYVSYRSAHTQNADDIEALEIELHKEEMALSRIDGTHSNSELAEVMHFRPETQRCVDDCKLRIKVWNKAIKAVQGKIGRTT